VVINVKDNHKICLPFYHYLSISTHLTFPFFFSVMLQASTICLFYHSFLLLTQSHTPSVTASYSIKSSTLTIFISGSLPLCQHYKVYVLMVSLMVSDLCIKLHLQRSSKSTHNSLPGLHLLETDLNLPCFSHAKVLVLVAQRS